MFSRMKLFMMNLNIRVALSTVTLALLWSSTIQLDIPSDIKKRIWYNRSDYCKIKCNNEEHTLCLYESREPSCRITFMETGYGMGEDTLTFHNQMRNDLSLGDNLLNKTLPTATNMRLLKWDAELAAIAERWVSQCILGGPDKCRNTVNAEVGQNFGSVKGKERDDEDGWQSILLMWMNEKDVVTSDSLKSFSEKKGISNLAQMLWHSTDRIGCSTVTFKRNEDEIHVFACNYAPKGNKEGEPVYLAGTPCSQCPVGTKCNVSKQFPLLCGSYEDFTDEDDFRAVNITTSGAGFDAYSVIPLMSFFLNIFNK